MITLLYANNLHKYLVCEIGADFFLKESDEKLQDALLHLYQSNGYADANDPQKIYLRRADGEIQPLLGESILQDGDVILYLMVIVPENAQEYAREHGIIYFFHTAEQGHLNYPHIHAWHGGEEISVYFSDFHVVGKMKHPVQKKVLRYIKANLVDLTNKWNEILKRI